MPNQRKVPITLKSRTNINEGTAKDNPGPGTYEDQYRKITTNMPMISLASRYQLKDVEPTPAPNEYSVNNRYTSKSAPQFSFGIKHGDGRKDDKFPGPGTYED